MLDRGSEAEEHRIVFHGEYDLDRKNEVRELLARIDGKRPVIIDLRTVTYADSSFLHELGRLRKRLERCPIKLLGPQPILKRVLALLSFEQLFEIVDAE